MSNIQDQYAEFMKRGMALDRFVDDKLITLSAGFLALSIVLLPLFQESVIILPLLIFSWICFLFTICFVLLSVWACRESLCQILADIEQGRDTQVSEYLKRPATLLTRAAETGFILGIISYAVFIGMNLSI